MLHTSQHVNDPLAIWAARGSSSGHQTLLFKVVHALTCIEFDIDKRFFSLSPHLEFHINPLKKSN